MPAKKHRNPFYVLLVIAGIVFAVTAFAYGFMAFQVANAMRDQAIQHSEHPLFVWLRANGDTALLVELGVLALLTVGAIAADHWWDETKRLDQEPEQVSPTKAR